MVGLRYSITKTGHEKSGECGRKRKKKPPPGLNSKELASGKRVKEPIRERETFLPCRIWNSGLAYGAGRMRGVFSFDLARVERTGAPRAAAAASSTKQQQAEGVCGLGFPNQRLGGFRRHDWLPRAFFICKGIIESKNAQSHFSCLVGFIF